MTRDDAALAVALFLGACIFWMVATPAHSASGNPQDVTCQPAKALGASIQVQCAFLGTEYSPPGYDGPRHPVRFIYPKDTTGLTLSVDLQGSPADTFCTSGAAAQPGRLLVRVCASGWPNVSQWLGSGYTDWGGPFLGTNSMGWRVSSALRYAQEQWSDKLDAGAGIHLQGTSQGGTTALLQAMLLQDIDLRNKITVVYANLPHTCFVCPGGQYSADPAARRAWGDYPLRKANPHWQAALGAFDGMYFSIHGASNDSLGRMPAGFQGICDRNRLSCYMTWDQGGHSAGDGTYQRKRFQGGGVRLDKPLPVITDSSLDVEGATGHHGHGVYWRDWVSYGPALVLPLVCEAPCTFRFMLRRAAAGEWDWQLGSLSGRVTSEGMLDLGQVTLPQGETPLVLIPAPTEPPLVYSRQPRDRSPITGTQVQEGANWQRKSDAGRPLKSTESDLVYDDGRTARVLFDCTTTPRICAAQDASVSHDGRYIFFSVSYGNTLTPIAPAYLGSKVIKDKEFMTTTSELWVHDLRKDETRRLTSGVRDRYPVMCGHDRLLFTSDRGGTWPPYGSATGNFYPFKSAQLWSATWKDGALGDFRNLTPHEAYVLSPECLSNGDILYSSYQGHTTRAQETSTPPNLWWIAVINGNGSNALTIMSLGAHNAPYIPTGSLIRDILHPTKGGMGVSAMLALRPARQIAKVAGKPYVGVTSYYRSNHMAMGEILGYTVGEVEGVSIRNNWQHRESDHGAEGSGQFVPADLRSLTPAWTGMDVNPRHHKDGRAMGKGGYPSPYPGDRMLVTWGRGACYEAILTDGQHMGTRAAMGGEPTCHQQIALAPIEGFRDPFAELEVIACQDDRWHCWDARAVVPYSDLFGQDEPRLQVPLPLGAETELRVVNLRASELAPIPTGDPVQQEKWRRLLQGFAVPNPDERTDRFCVDLIEDWRQRPTHQGPKSQTLHACAQPLADGSLRLPVPPERTFVMYGVDSTASGPCLEMRHGMCVTAIDQIFHSVRAGEARTCHGCHDAHSVERHASYGGKSAEERFAQTLAGQYP